MGRQRKATQESLPAEWVPRQVKGPVLVPQRSQTSGCTFLTLWAWDIKVAMLVGIGGSFLPEAAGSCCLEGGGGGVKSLRVEGETPVEFNAGLGVNAFMNA